jgi:hypothetical protein
LRNDVPLFDLRYGERLQARLTDGGFLVWSSNRQRRPGNTRVVLRPGPVRLALENRTENRVLPAVWAANQALDDLLKQSETSIHAIERAL